MASSVSDLREELLSLSGIDIMQADGQTFKSTYQIFEELSKVYSSLSDVSQANILELIAGKRQSNIASAILTNFDQAEAALKASLNSDGSALDEYDKYLDSIEGKTAQLSATWESFSDNFMDSSFIKGVVDVLRSLLGVLNSITEKIGGLATTGILGGAGLVGLKMVKSVVKNGGIVNTVKSLVSEGGKLSNFASGLSSLAKGFTGTASSAAAATSSYESCFEAFLALNDETLIATEATAEAATGFSGLASALATLAPAVGVLALGIGSLLIIQEIDDEYRNGWKKTLSDASKNAKEASESYESLSDAQRELNEAQAVIKNPLSSQEEVDAAKAKIQEIADMLNEKYELNIEADATKLDAVLSKLTTAERLEALTSANEFIESFTEGVSGQKSGLVVYQESASYIAENVSNQEKLNQLASEYADLQTEISTVMQTAKTYEKAGLSTTDEIKQANALYSKLLDINSEYEAMGYSINDGGALAQLKDGVNSLDDMQKMLNSINLTSKSVSGHADTITSELNESRENIEAIKSSISDTSKALANTLLTDVLNGDTKNVDADRVSFIQLGESVKEAGIATKDLAMQYAYAKTGYSSFSEAVANGKLEEVVSNIIAIQTDFGESVEESVQTAALAMTGFSDSTEITSDKVIELYNNMKSLGEQYSLEDATSNALTGTAMLASNFDSLNEVILSGTDGITSFITQYKSLLTQTDESFANSGLSEQAKKLSEIAQNLGLIDGNSTITVDVEGNVQVKDIGEIKATIKAEFNKYDIESELDKLSEGGSVDLKLKPVIDASDLTSAGWEGVSEDEVTSFASTYSNAAGTIAINFTPIITDHNGNCVGIMSPEELQAYAEGVINGTREDDLNLQIGGVFRGDDAIQQAQEVAEKIHDLQEKYYGDFGELLASDETFQGLTTSAKIELIGELVNDGEIEGSGIAHLVAELVDDEGVLNAEGEAILKAELSDDSDLDAEGKAELVGELTEVEGIPEDTIIDLIGEIVNDGTLSADGVADLVGEIKDDGKLSATGTAHLDGILNGAVQGSIFLTNQNELNKLTGSAKVSLDINDEPLKNLSGKAKIDLYYDNNIDVYVTKHITEEVTTVKKYSGTASTRGLSYSRGSAITGMSYASGNWGIPYDQTALVGEVGKELVSLKASA